MTSTFPPVSAPTVCVWINGDAAEAAAYYSQALPLTASAPGVSMTLLYQDQAGIDGAWQVLSQVADAERCGWCVDAYGVSWQVLPQNIGDLMADTDAHAKLLSMGKIDMNQL